MEIENLYQKIKNLISPDKTYIGVISIKEKTITELREFRETDIDMWKLVGNNTFSYHIGAQPPTENVFSLYPSVSSVQERTNPSHMWVYSFSPLVLYFEIWSHDEL